MFEALGLVFFAGIVHLFLIVVPTIVENVSNPEFKKSYLKNLSEKYINSFGR